jgi:hypothetical protein
MMPIQCLSYSFSYRKPLIVVNRQGRALSQGECIEIQQNRELRVLGTTRHKIHVILKYINGSLPMENMDGWLNS